jgi:SGNH domain (fused to AT3 domains)
MLSIVRIIFDFLAKKPEIRIVVLAFFGNYIAADNYAADHVTKNAGPAQTTLHAKGYEGRSKSDILLFGLENVVTALTGKEIVLFVDVPELPFFPTRCIARPLVGIVEDCAIPRSLVDKRQREFRAVLAKLQSVHPQIKLFDPIDVFCNLDVCSPIKGGQLLYNDSHHMSLRASRLVAARFLRTIGSSPER